MLCLFVVCLLLLLLFFCFFLGGGGLPWNVGTMTLGLIDSTLSRVPYAGGISNNRTCLMVQSSSAFSAELVMSVHLYPFHDV